MHSTSKNRSIAEQRPAPGTGRSCRLLVAAILIAIAMPAPATAQYNPGLPARDGHTVSLHQKRGNLNLIERSSRIIELPDSIEYVTDFDPAILSAEGITDRQVRLTAIAPGVTTVVFVDLNGVSRELEVFVKGDTRYLQANLRQLFPDANIEAIQVGDTGEAVVLRGWVTDPAHVAEIIDVAREFYTEVKNQLRTATNERVLLEVRILEVNRTKLREFGFDFLNVGSTVRLGSSTAGLSPIVTDEMAGGLTVLEQTFNASNFGLQIVKPGYNFFGFLQALQTQSLAKILAEPKLVTTSGRPATLLSGGEFPILVPQGVGTTSIEFREYGIRVEAVPVVLGNNRLRLDIAPEVSERDFANAVNVDGIQIPGLTTRRVNTGAEMSFGETLMLGGLVSTRDVGLTRKVPFLGELPYIGMAFSRKSYSQSETELLIMVTPYPAGTLNPECLPAGPGLNTTFPTDIELYVDGLLELPNYGNECSDTNLNCGPPMMMHGTGPCSSGRCGTFASSSQPTMYAAPSGYPAEEIGPAYEQPYIESQPATPMMQPTPTQTGPGLPMDGQFQQPVEMQPQPAAAGGLTSRFGFRRFRKPAVVNVDLSDNQAGQDIMQTSGQQAVAQPPVQQTQVFQQPTAAAAPSIRPKRTTLRSKLSVLKSSY